MSHIFKNKYNLNVIKCIRMYNVLYMTNKYISHSSHFCNALSILITREFRSIARLTLF